MEARSIKKPKRHFFVPKKIRLKPKKFSPLRSPNTRGKGRENYLRTRHNFPEIKKTAEKNKREEKARSVCTQNPGLIKREEGGGGGKKYTLLFPPAGNGGGGERLACADKKMPGKSVIRHYFYRCPKRPEWFFPPATKKNAQKIEFKYFGRS